MYQDVRYQENGMVNPQLQIEIVMMVDLRKEFTHIWLNLMKTSKHKDETNY